MQHMIGGVEALGWVALKAFLLYITAVIGFRLGERRTLTEMSAFDFIAAVAVGAIIGRVSNASDTSYLAGAMTLVTVLTVHRIITRLRYFPRIARLIDHDPVLLVAHGHVIESELRRCGMTHSDLYGVLRQHGVDDLAAVRFVIFEQRGRISIVRNTEKTDAELPLVRDIVARASSQQS